LCFTHSYMMPDVRMPWSTALRIEPQRRMRLIARRWCSWPVSAMLASARWNAEAGAEECLLDVVVAERVAGEDFVDVTAADEARIAPGPLPVWTIAGPPTMRGLAAASAIRDEIAGDFSDQGAFRLLGRYAARHEGEIAADGGALDWNDTHTTVAHDDRHSAFDFGHWNAAGRWKSGVERPAHSLWFVRRLSRQSIS